MLHRLIQRISLNATYNENIYNDRTGGVIICFIHIHNVEEYKHHNTTQLQDVEIIPFLYTLDDERCGIDLTEYCEYC